ncbi:RloB domain-containing protein [Fulvivirgaceae bacterium PWU5]|uniref:RloB domain-containing protein n=1 Tax=Dawidia cretensis TaxID=2782350 RepID=A0AAP2DZU7_9BACT|nr:RloB family protein [Dawidia cretensis]MBT1709449.1 RloB domain-containing protein [Dawidia cretensis]
MADWNIKEVDTRTPDKVATFVIFCEDEDSEIEYLQHLENERVKINPIRGQKSDFRNVSKAIAHCRRHDFFRGTGDDEKLSADGVHVWCVFDRDRNENDADELDVAFDQSILIAQRRGLGVAWSNDAFELWILLHLRDVNPDDVANLSREEYYNRLTEIFRTLPTENPELIRIRNWDDFTYKKHLKPKKRFIPIVKPAILNSVQDAIRRAQELEAHHNVLDRHLHEKAPCTMMHHLVLALMAVGSS